MNEAIRKFIIEEIAEDSELQLSFDDKIIEDSIIDSTEVLKLVVYIEKEFDIKVENEDISLSNFSSINGICNFINEKRRLTKSS